MPNPPSSQDNSSNITQPSPLSRRLIRWGSAVVIFALCFRFFPYYFSSMDNDGWFEGALQKQLSLAEGVAAWSNKKMTRKQFHSGSPKFDGEWLFASYMFAGMGFGQIAVEHPSERKRSLRRMAKAIRSILQPSVRQFDKEAWRSDPIDSLSTSDHHASFLGYFNLLLSLHRYLDVDSPFAELNDKITETLVKRIKKSRIWLLESYPHEVFPIDNCAVIGSIGLHDKAVGKDRRAWLSKWFDELRKRYVNKKTGLITQSVDSFRGQIVDGPRGSGTAVCAYFTSFADKRFAGELWKAVRKELAETFMGFGVIREYPRGVVGSGDIDSGPVLFGWSVSATGFALSGARMFGDKAFYQRILATVRMFGAPYHWGSRMKFITGGPIGNSIMFGMMTAQPPDAFVYKFRKSPKKVSTGKNPSNIRPTSRKVVTPKAGGSQ